MLILGSRTLCTKLYENTFPVTTRAFRDAAQQTIWHDISCDHKNLLGCCSTDYMTWHLLWPQEPSGMLHNRLYDMTSPVTTRTFWDAAQETIWHDISCDHKNLLGCCARNYMTWHLLWPQEHSGMLHNRLYDMTSPVTTRTFWDAA